MALEMDGMAVGSEPLGECFDPGCGSCTLWRKWKITLIQSNMRTKRYTGEIFAIFTRPLASDVSPLRATTRV